jgi:hypothetical protein
MSAQTQPIQRFGDPQEAFDINTLKGLILKAQTLDDLKIAKYYLLSYFILCSSPHGVYLWRPDINNFEHKLVKEVGMQIRSIKRVFYKPTSNPEDRPERIEFDIRRWFFNENNIVCVSNCDPYKPHC